MEWQRELYHLNDPRQLLQRGHGYLENDQPHRAATAFDRAFGLCPSDPEIVGERRALLDKLSKGSLRYIPGGYFRMGSKTGEPDEAPVHLALVEPFWFEEAPVSWEDFARVRGYRPPPLAHGDEEDYQNFMCAKLRLQYCEDHTTRAFAWHVHYEAATGEDLKTGRKPPRPDLPHSYRAKPVIAVDFAMAQEYCRRSSTRLPSEEEWEKADRGGLIDQAYPWGNAQPGPDNCDFHRFDQFSIQPSRRYPPNAYGLYAMCGGVWEWTSSFYDALAYRGHQSSSARMRVVRGGSWADCAPAVTVSFRHSLPEFHFSANVGFRVCAQGSVV